MFINHDMLLSVQINSLDNHEMTSAAAQLTFTKIQECLNNPQEFSSLLDGKLNAGQKEELFRGTLDHLRNEEKSLLLFCLVGFLVEERTGWLKIDLRGMEEEREQPEMLQISKEDAYFLVTSLSTLSVGKFDFLQTNEKLNSFLSICIVFLTFDVLNCPRIGFSLLKSFLSVNFIDKTSLITKLHVDYLNLANVSKSVKEATEFVCFDKLDIIPGLPALQTALFFYYLGSLYLSYASVANGLKLYEQALKCFRLGLSIAGFSCHKPGHKALLFDLKTKIMLLEIIICGYDDLVQNGCKHGTLNISEKVVGSLVEENRFKIYLRLRSELLAQNTDEVMNVFVEKYKNIFKEDGNYGLVLKCVYTRNQTKLKRYLKIYTKIPAKRIYPILNKNCKEDHPVSEAKLMVNLRHMANSGFVSVKFGYEKNVNDMDTDQNNRYGLNLCINEQYGVCSKTDMNHLVGLSQFLRSFHFKYVHSLPKLESAKQN